MHVMPRTLPISQMGKRPNIVAPMLKEGPIVITSRSEEIGVMVDFDQWNQSARRLAFLERMLLGDRASADIQAGKFHTEEEFEAMLDG